MNRQISGFILHPFPSLDFSALLYPPSSIFIGCGSAAIFLSDFERGTPGASFCTRRELLRSHLTGILSQNSPMECLDCLRSLIHERTNPFGMGVANVPAPWRYADLQARRKNVYEVLQSRTCRCQRPDNLAPSSLLIPKIRHLTFHR